MDISEFLLLFKGQAGPAVASIKEVKGGLTELDAKSEGTSSKLAGIGGNILKGAAMLAIGGLVAGIGLATDAASKEQASMAKLNTTLSDAGTKWTPQLTSAFDGLEKKQRSLGFANVDTTDSVQKMVQAGVPLADALKYVAAASDLARAKNIDLGTATDALIKGAMGQGRELKTLGILLPTITANTAKLQAAQAAVVKDTTALSDAIAKHGQNSTQAAAASVKLAAAQKALATETASAHNPMANMGQVIDAVSGKTKGQAQAFSQTLPGAIEVMKASLDGVMAKIGDKIIPILTTLAGWFAKNSDAIGNVFSVALGVLGTALTVVGNIVGWVADHFNVIGPIVATVMGIFVAFRLVMLAQMVIGGVSLAYSLFALVLSGEVTPAMALTAIGAEGLGVAIDFATGPIGLIVLAIAAMIAVVVLIITHFQTFKDVLGAVGNFIKGVFVGAFNFIKTIIGNVIGWLSKNWPLILAILGGPIGLAVLFIVTHLTQIKDFFVSIFNDIKGFVTGVVRDIVGVFQGLATGIGNVFTGIWNAAKSVWNDITGVVKGAVNAVIGWINDFIDMIDGVQIHMHIPEGIPMIGGKGVDWGGFGIPHVPTLSTGGIAKQAMAAVIGDAVGGEAVMNRPQARDFAAWAGLSGGTGQSQAGGDTNVTVYHPTSNVDVVTALQNQRWLDRMNLRGIRPPAEFPAGAPA